MSIPIIFQILLIFPYFGKYYCLPIEEDDDKSGKEIEQILDSNIESLGLLLNTITLSSNFTTGDPELDSLFQDDLIPELYSVLDDL
ncbi:AHL_G0008790.mRNA.1.CDS.1 [Saccharomyces cerevisiae]|uniref:RNA-directed RNA polymerase n=1 Tax=Saccharomyces paradoxus TaxID=27291 RepID=A0A8B8UNA8_SACPA|nr:uncharacterized protein SPAR_D02160 [Saccharomyces paradoxus]AJU88507.1 hypothetical protein H790_YJM1252D00226 [Saccharomyces cerevisiae YJM1252]QHS72217.1 hypothetical protein SPAR_D02160 [Saccharomyces paradoxus]CAI4872573.1 AHL_G0008790.mRNA.1.CDS.1 [Saccharomyces cerevisiae]CAI6547617.1 AHL_G0008790.mRNA.1.CDS.1 [Saccharomyces cerevisiae]